VRACELGLSVLVIDDQSRAGGQILRRPPEAFNVGNWLSQRVYKPLHDLYARFVGLHEALTHLHDAAVLGVELCDGGFRLQILTPDGLVARGAERVIVAAGCFDMPLAFPGAQLPGVMAAGGLQAFLKSQQTVPGDRFLFVGTHPLQLIVANQIAGAGGEVAGVVFAQPMRAFLGLLGRPATLLRQLPNMLLIIGVIAQLLARRVPLRFGGVPLRAEGDAYLERVQLGSAATGEPWEPIRCDRLGICFGFLTNNDLLRQAGARCQWSQTAGGWAAEHDSGMRASIPGIYVAGETTGVGGANVARYEGELAALTAVFDAGILSGDDYDSACRQLARPLAAAREFATLLADFAYPGGDLLARLMDDDTYLCKCEEVTVGAVRTALTENPDIGDLSALKLFTRCGMGHCQGRYCHYQSRLVLARERGADPGSLGGFTARFPSRPVPVAALAAAADPVEES
jgi:thioredoxin reductase